MSEVLAWHPHPDVWMVVALLAGGYWIASQRNPQNVPLRKALAWYGGVALLWIASDWPIHDIAEESLFTFHMTEHLLLALGSAPLLLIGLPEWMMRSLLERTRATRYVKLLSRPIFAFFIFNAVLASIHWPLLVRAMVTSEWAHLGIHFVLFSAALLMWMPVLSPLSEVARLRPPTRMAYLFAHSLIPTVPASFLTFSRSPLYDVYVGVPRPWGWDAVTDQTVAGVVMKLGGGMVFWVAIAVIWFRWYAVEQSWDRIEAQLREP